MQLADLIAELNEVMMGDRLKKQVEREAPNLSSDEALAQYVAVTVATLYGRTSSDRANLERITASLGYAIMTLETVIDNLQQLKQQTLPGQFVGRHNEPSPSRKLHRPDVLAP